jgi:hypothetical protein
VTTDERLERVERELAELRLELLRHEDTVRTRRIGLVDEEGRVRGLLAANGDGPGLILCDENGHARAVLASLKDGPVLDLRDEKATRRAAAV